MPEGDITERRQAGLAREEALRSVRQHARRLKVLTELDRAILALSSPEAIARVALAHMGRLVPGDAAMVWNADHESRQLVMLASDVGAETFDLRPGARVNISDLGRYNRPGSSEPILVSSLYRARSLSPLASARRDQGAASLLWVPMIAHDQLIGILEFLARRSATFSRGHANIAREVAEALAVAIAQARLLEQVRRGRQRQEALSRRLIEAQEAERRHVARELHDQIGQLLTGLKLSLDLVGLQSSPTARDMLNEANAITNELIDRMRQLSLDLRPAMLDDLGLVPTLLWYVGRYRSHTQLHVVMQHEGVDGRRWRPEIETTAYRIVQEALTNAARHARATTVTLRLRADEGTLLVQVEDDGRGFDVQSTLAGGQSSGLSGLRERALLAGGKATIESVTGVGTRVIAELPLKAAVERRERRICP